MDAPIAEREVGEGRCDACGADALKRYPVLSDGGWFMVTKCQRCLHSQHRERWHRLGYVQRLGDVL